MRDHVGVFIDGGYLLRSGTATLLRDRVPKVTPHRFNVLAFKNEVVSLVERLIPNSRILRIYWYEREAEADDLEYRRRVILAKNGIKLRTFAHETDENAIATATLDRICDDIQNLTNSGAINDAIVVTEEVDFEDLIDDVQAKGVHVHFIEIQRRELYLTLDLRSRVDTFSPWTTDSLRKFLLPNDGRTREDQDRLLDPQELDIQEETEAPEIEEQTSSSLVDDYESVAAPLAPAQLAEDEFDEFLPASDAFAPAPVDVAEISPHVRAYAEKMLDHQIRTCVQYWRVGRRDVPTIHDKNVLATCREGLQRNLSPEERKVMRDEFMRLVNQLFVQRGLDAPRPRLETRAPTRAARYQIDIGTGDERLSSRSSAGFGSVQQDEVEEVAQTEITEYVEIFVAGLNDEEVRICLQYWNSAQYGVPAIFDKGVMAMCRQELSRNLGEREKYFMRSEFKRITNEIALERGVF